MKHRKYLLMGLVIVGTSYSIGAATGTKITAMLKNQGMIVNGSSINKQVILYKDTTYLPLRQIGEMLNVAVDYKNGQIILGKSNSVQVQKADEIKYKQYTNARFGFTISYPDFLTTKIEPENGDGITLYNKDKTTKLITWGSNNVLEATAASEYRDELKRIKNILYKQQKGNWYVISWKEGSNIHYKKCIINEDTMYGFEVQYPESEKDKYDKIIEKLNGSFKILG